VNSADLWTFVFLALILKIPLLGVLGAIWYAARQRDRSNAEPLPPTARMALCAYCGTRITMGYDAVAIHAEAARVAAGSGEALFDVETRLVRDALRGADHFVVEPDRCPGCGELAVWTPIEPLDPARQPLLSGPSR
jgi:hypothetical protein